MKIIKFNPMSSSKNVHGHNICIMYFYVHYKIINVELHLDGRRSYDEYDLKISKVFRNTFEVFFSHLNKE